MSDPDLPTAAEWQAGGAARASLALSRYGFSTPDIRLFLSRYLACPSDRTVKKYCHAKGNWLKVGRRRVSTRVSDGEAEMLLVLSHMDPEVFGGNMLHLISLAGKRFSLSPRQFLNWMAKEVRQGGMTLRPCLRCKRPFPSRSPSDRVGPCCREEHQKALREATMSLEGWDYI